MNIRYARMMDKQDLYELFCEVYQLKYEKDKFDNILWENINNPLLSCMVAVKDEIVVGYVSLSIEKSLHQMGYIARIQDFLVHEDNLFIAQELFATAFQKAKKVHCLYMEADLMDDHVLTKMEDVYKSVINIPSIYRFPM